MDSTTLKAMAVSIDGKQLEADKARSPALTAAYDAEVAKVAALKVAAKAVTDKLSAQGATIAGAATEIAALVALY